MRIDVIDRLDDDDTKTAGVTRMTCQRVTSLTVVISLHSPRRQRPAADGGHPGGHGGAHSAGRLSRRCGGS